MDKLYFQDEMVHNNCFGCGPSNEHGLRIKSFWDENEGESGVGENAEAVCIWRPEPYHLAGPEHVLNGGIIATIIDCHSICTAIAHAYAGEGRAISTKPVIWYVTASLRVSYMKPTPIESPVELRARVIEESGKKSVVECSLSSLGVKRAVAEVLAIRVPAELWYDAHGQKRPRRGVVGIYIAPSLEAPMEFREEVSAEPGKGLQSDRYYEGRGTYSGGGGSGREVTLISLEAIEKMRVESGIDIKPGDARRNIVTTGVDLGALIGREFRIGEVRLRGVRPCEPCSHLEKLTKRGIKKALAGRGGLRADILSPGKIRFGDPVEFNH